MLRRTAAALLAALAVIALSACTSSGVADSTRASESPSPTTFDAVETFESWVDREWQLVSGTVDGVELSPNAASRITLGVMRDEQGEITLGGRSCNSWSAPLDDLAAARVGFTDVGCDDELTFAESAVIDAVGRLTAVGDDDGILTLLGDDVELRWVERAPLDREALIDVTWSMQSLAWQGDNLHVPEGTSWTLLTEGTITVASDCAVLTGEWEASRFAVLLGAYQIDGDCEVPDEMTSLDPLSAFTNGFTASLTDGVLTTTSFSGVVATHIPAAVTTR